MPMLPMYDAGPCVVLSSAVLCCAPCMLIKGAALCCAPCRLIKGGGVYLNNQKVSEELRMVSEGDLIDGRLMLIAAGKKNKMLIRVT